VNQRNGFAGDAVAGNLKEFLTQPESPHDSIVPNSAEIQNQELPALAVKDVQGNSLKEKFDNLKSGLDSLVNLMKRAEHKFDDYTRSGLEALRQMFPSQRTSIQRVRLPKDLVDFYGGDASKLEFGAQTITSDAQFEKLQQDVEMVKKYFGDDIALHRITYNNGKPPVAVVMGVDAELFNAVIKAERQKTQMEDAIKATAKEMMKSHPEVTQQNMDNLDRASNMVIDVNKSVQMAQSVAFSPGQQKGPNIREV
jgi:hypothetical protein